MTAIQELISRQHTNATIQERINNMAADGSVSYPPMKWGGLQD
jgi:hypothetical protein